MTIITQNNRVNSNSTRVSNISNTTTNANSNTVSNTTNSTNNSNSNTNNVRNINSIGNSHATSGIWSQ